MKKIFLFLSLISCSQILKSADDREAKLKQIAQKIVNEERLNHRTEWVKPEEVSKLRELIEENPSSTSNQYLYAVVKGIDPQREETLKKQWKDIKDDHSGNFYGRIAEWLAGLYEGERPYARFLGKEYIKPAKIEKELPRDVKPKKMDEMSRDRETVLAQIAEKIVNRERLNHRTEWVKPEEVPRLRELIEENPSSTRNQYLYAVVRADDNQLEEELENIKTNIPDHKSQDFRKAVEAWIVSLYDNYRPYARYLAQKYVKPEKMDEMPRKETKKTSSRTVTNKDIILLQDKNGLEREIKHNKQPVYPRPVDWSRLPKKVTLPLNENKKPKVKVSHKVPVIYSLGDKKATNGELDDLNINGYFYLFKHHETDELDTNTMHKMHIGSFIESGYLMGNGDITDIKFCSKESHNYLAEAAELLIRMYYGDEFLEEQIKKHGSAED